MANTEWAYSVMRAGRVSGAALQGRNTDDALCGIRRPRLRQCDGGPSDRPEHPRRLHPWPDRRNPNTAPLILSRDRFAYIQPGETRGHVGRNTFRNSRIANLKGAVSKQWTFHGPRMWSAMLGAEAYNLTNTPQFNEHQRNLTSPSFGRITNTLNDGRVL